MREVYQFDEFSLSTTELRRDGRRLALEPRPHAVLYFLVQHRGEIVSKERLHSALWPDVFVTDAALAKAVDRVRAALNDRRAPHRYVATRHRRGWQFVAEVRVSSAGPLFLTASPHPASERVEEPAHPGDRSRFIRDVNLPDGGSVLVNESFVKSWEIQNVGSVPWIDRFLTRQGPADAPGRLRSADRVPLPTTWPGGLCLVSIALQAPSTPGSCHAEWKMTDAEGRQLLPNQTSVYLTVDVRERPRGSAGSG